MPTCYWVDERKETGDTPGEMGWKQAGAFDRGFLRCMAAQERTRTFWALERKSPPFCKNQDAKGRPDSCRRRIVGGPPQKAGSVGGDGFRGECRDFFAGDAAGFGVGGKHVVDGIEADFGGAR